MVFSARRGRAVTPKPTFADLYGIGDRSWFDPTKRWQGEDLATFEVPIGFDATGAAVSLDFGRWSSLDDHVAVIAAPGAGTTTLLRTAMIGLTILRSPEHVNILAVEGQPSCTQYGDFGKAPHCTGHVTYFPDETAAIGFRLSEVLRGEVARRERLLADSDAATLDDYRYTVSRDGDGELLPELFIVLDNFSALRPELDDGLQLALATGRQLGLHVIAGIPYRDWAALAAAGLLEGFTGRIALGLSRGQVSATLDVEVTDDLESPGNAYVMRLDSPPQRATIVNADTAPS